jgi:hypothetical protein
MACNILTKKLLKETLNYCTYEYDYAMGNEEVEWDCAKCPVRVAALDALEGEERVNTSIHSLDCIVGNHGQGLDTRILNEELTLDEGVDLLCEEYLDPMAVLLEEIEELEKDER